LLRFDAATATDFARAIALLAKEKAIAPLD
jgi:hypothetical protein